MKRSRLRKVSNPVRKARMRKLSDEEVEREFTHIIREKLTEDQFWKWVGSWKDSDAICEQAEDWDIETKRNELRELEKFL